MKKLNDKITRYNLRQASNYFYERIMEVLLNANVKDDEIDVMMDILLNAETHKEIKDLFEPLSKKYINI